jgi:ribosomal-protein-alanine N-acetyltransferase
LSSSQNAVARINSAALQKIISGHLPVGAWQSHNIEPLAPKLDEYGRMETDRLLLLLADPELAPALSELMHPRASQQLASWPWPLTDEAARGIIAQFRADMAARHALAWVMMDRATGRPAGWISAKLSPEIAEDLVLLSYWVGADFEGRGLTTEAAAAIIQPALRWTGATRLGACIYPGNARSVGVAARLGLHDLGLRPMFWSETRQRHELTLCFGASREALDVDARPGTRSGTA